MNRIYVGIDPGKTGGIAVLGDEIRLFPMPDESNPELMRTIFKGFISDTDNYKVILERPVLIPHIVKKVCPKCKSWISTAVMQQGVLTSLINYGILIGLLKAYSIPYEEIESSKWKKAFKLTKDKKLSIAMAKQLYPELTDTIKQKDGLAEALLIAEYGRRNL